ncbi:MAG: cyclic nucleotide-binding domain-containing protein [bacterium]
MTIAECLKVSEVFKGFNDESIDKIAEDCEIVEFGKDQYIFVEGTTDDCSLFIVMEGEILISTEIVEKDGTMKQDAFILALMEPGDTFGEMSLVDGSPRSATARANRETRLVRMPEETFDQLTSERSDIGMTIFRNIARLLCRRLREMDFAVKHQAFMG